MWIRVVFIILCFFVTHVSVQSAEDDIKQQINIHRNWVESHVPLPDTLSLEALFVETTKAIFTSCLENRYVDIINYTGEKYDLSQLIKYADIRYKREIDKDDFHARQCLKELLEKSKTINMPSDYATAYIAMFIVLTARDKDKEAEWIKIFYESSRKLYEYDKSTKNEELWLFAQFIQESGGGLLRFENPLTYEKCRIIMADIIKFYSRTHIISEIRAYLFEYISEYCSKFSLYSNYYAYINNNLFERNDSILTGKFPSSYLTEDIGEELQSDSIDYTYVAIKILEKKYHAYHPDVIGLKKTYFFSDDSRGKVTDDEIKRVLSFIKIYYGEHSHENASANILLRSYRVWKQNYNDIDTKEDLEIESSYFSEESLDFLNLLEQELSTQVFSGQTERALLLSKRLSTIAKNYYPDDIIQELSYHGLDWYFQKKGVTGYETAFDDLCQTYIDNCDKDISFEAIGLGKTLANTAQTVLSDPVTTLTLQRKILQLLLKITGKNHPLFSLEYILYGQMVASAYPIDAITLEGENDENALFSDIVSVARQFNCAYLAMMAAGRRQAIQGNALEARMFFNQAIHEIEKESKSQQLTDIEKESNRYYLAGLYAYILQTLQTYNTGADSIDYYGKRLVEQFAEGFEFDPTFHSDIYTVMITYYMFKKQYNEVENLLNKCLDYYDTNPNSRVDGFYIQLMQGLINLYGNVYNDMDKCLLIAEKIEKDVEKIKDFGNDETYIGLLRTLYDLVEYKNPYDLLLLLRYLQPLEKAITQYTQTSKNENVLYNHGLYLVSKMVNFAQMEPQYRAMARANSSEKDFDVNMWQPLKENLVDIILPEMQEMKEQIEMRFPNVYKQTPVYQQIIHNLAILSYRCLANEKQAEDYYILLSQCNEQMGLLQLGNFYLETNQVGKAVQTFSRCEEIINHSGNNNAEDLYSGIRSQVYSRIFMAYYRAGEYKKALKAANIYYETVQTQIKTNFDLYTQAEREGFLMQYGAGGTLLQCLLPHIGDELSPKVYNVLLQEKGLLLRASERVRRAILASGDSRLIQAIDSLQILQQELTQMANTPEALKRSIELREAYENLEKYINRASEPYRHKEDSVPTWEQVRSCLKTGEASVEFGVTDSIVWALVLTAKSEIPHCVVLARNEDLSSLQERIMTNSNNMVRLAEQFYEKDLEHLYEKFWKPIEKYLDGIETVYYSPSGFLNVLSFAAFKLPDGGYLIDKYDLHQLTSTGKLAGREKRNDSKKEKRNAKIFGAIFYSEEQKNENSSLISEARSQHKSRSSPSLNNH